MLSEPLYTAPPLRCPLQRHELNAVTGLAAADPLEVQAVHLVPGPAGKGKLQLRLGSAHELSNGRSLVWVSGLHGRLDGQWWRVDKVDPESQTLVLNLGVRTCLTAEEVGAVNARLARVS